MFSLIQAPSGDPASSDMSISAYFCKHLGQAKAIFLSVLLHSVFRAVFKAAICFPSQTQQLGLRPGVRLIVQKCDSDLDFVMGEGAALSFLRDERSLAKAFVTQFKCKPQSWRTYSDRRSFGQLHLYHSQHSYDLRLYHDSIACKCQQTFSVFTAMKQHRNPSTYDLE